MLDFGPYADRVKSYKRYAIDNWGLRDCDCKEKLVDLSGPDSKLWTKEDLKTLATNRIAYGSYEFLLKLCVDLTSAYKNKDLKTYHYAYAALAELAPKDFPTAEAFFTVINTIYAENSVAVEATRIEHKKYHIDSTKEYLIKHGATTLTKADLVAMNALPDGKNKKLDVNNFNNLLDACAVAKGKDDNGQPTETALYAQKMLGEFSIDGKWETLNSYINQIMADEINKERGLSKPETSKPADTSENKGQPKTPTKVKPTTKAKVKKAVAELDLQAIQINTVTKPETQQFDQQAALASLQHAGVVANTSHEQLNTPLGSKPANLNPQRVA